MSLLRRFRRPRAGEVWRGVHSRFSDVPRTGPGFAGEAWQRILRADAERAMAGEWNDEVVLEHEVLLLVLRVLASAGRKLHVVDFGGGCGSSYFYLRRNAPELELRYDVIEVPDVIAGARDLADGSLGFSVTIGTQHDAADVVFVKSALQYVEDYRATIRSLLRIGAAFLVFEKFSGVGCETYASAQVNVGDSSIPYWFISIPELLDLARDAGYECVLRRRLMRHYDQARFPARLRMDQASTLVFRKRAR